MKESVLPNEVMLDASEKALLKRCIDKLRTGSLIKELGKEDWKISRAEICETEPFLSEMQYFCRQQPVEYENLCDALSGLKRIGVFQFQFKRTPEMDSLPTHLVGRSLLIVTDEYEIEPIWRFVSLVST